MSESEHGKDKIRGAAGKGKKVAKRQAAPEVQAGTTQWNGLPAECPIVPLGVLGDVRYYLDTHKQLRPLPAGDHTRQKLTALFSNDINYIYTIPHWTRRNKDGDIQGIRPERLAEDLMIACGRSGLWDPLDNERGRGAWKGANGELILHTGDKVMVFGTYDPWGLRTIQQPGLVGRCVYAAADATAEPAIDDPPPNNPDPAELLLSMLETWNFRRQDLDAVLLLGWIAAAMIGGALTWRPSCWLTGGKGTGKSTLQALITHVLGGRSSVLSLQDTTKAGVYQMLKHQTLPVSLDEMEAGEDNRRTMGLVEIARLSASGGTMARGSDKNIPVNFTLRSCFVFSSVLVPPLLGTDRSRLAILDLDELPADAEPMALNEAKLKTIGAQLRRRLVTGWKRHETTVDFYKNALNAGGHSKRGAEQFGTLLACADMVLWPSGTDHRMAADWIARMHAGVLTETADDVRDEDQCWQHLLGTAIDPYRKGERTNVGEWINRAAGRCADWDTPKAAVQILQSYGIRLETILPSAPGARMTQWVAVANSHSVLAGLFERTRWFSPRGVQGVWTQALRRMPGAERSSRTLYFGGPTSKAVLLPLDLVPRPDAGEPSRPFDPAPGDPATA